MIVINNAAKSEIKNLYRKNSGKYLRIALDGDGCAGPYFALFLDEAGPDEELTRINGIDILVSDAVQRYAAVTTINVFVNASGEETA